jgi:nicotinamidase-related amidase
MIKHILREQGQSCVTDMPFGVVERIKDANALQPGDWGSQIVEEMTPQEGDLYSPKYGMCAFQTTELDSVLRSRGIKNVIVMGFLTNGSVESTIRTAYELCYNVFCPTDCCAACSMVEQQCSIELNFGLFAWNANAVKLTSALMA